MKVNRVTIVFQKDEQLSAMKAFEYVDQIFQNWVFTSSEYTPYVVAAWVTEATEEEIADPGEETE